MSISKSCGVVASAVVLVLIGAGLAQAPARAQTTPSAPRCASPYQDVGVTNTVQPIYPVSALALGLGRVTVFVQVSVSANGELLDAKVLKSSGNSDIDNAALRAAQESTYQPRIENCRGENAQYVFRADFTPPGASCSTPNRSVMVQKAVMPEFPPSVLSAGTGYQAIVAVKVDAQGHVLSVTIATSSGNAAVDQAILTAAQKSTYLPPLVDCKPMGGEGWFHAGFGAKVTPAPSSSGRSPHARS